MKVTLLLMRLREVNVFRLYKNSYEDQYLGSKLIEIDLFNTTNWLLRRKSIVHEKWVIFCNTLHKFF